MLIKCLELNWYCLEREGIKPVLILTLNINKYVSTIPSLIDLPRKRSPNMNIQSDLYCLWCLYLLELELSVNSEVITRCLSLVSCC